LLCLYQWGSHLFGTNGPNSDYDLVAVVRGYNYGVIKGQTDFAPDWQLVAVSTANKILGIALI